MKQEEKRRKREGKRSKIRLNKGGKKISNETEWDPFRLEFANL